MTARVNPVTERLATLFAEELHVDVPDSGVDLLATARLDSLGVVELIMHIEKDFGMRVELEDLELENFRTIDSIAAFITARLASAGVPADKR
jgi:methoxymalonate biosynthesis acyl carrier protein